MAIKLAADQLSQRTEPEALGFRTTDEIAQLQQIIGQDRAMEAIRFGVGMQRRGYNLFALGPPGLGKHTLVQEFLAERAKAGSVPPDLCYVYDFEQPHQPKALRLPAGVGRQLQRDMQVVVEEIRPALSAAFESDEFRARSRVVEQTLKGRQEQSFKGLQSQAAERDLVMLNTPVGIAFAPRKDGEVMPPEEFQKLPEPERQQIQQQIAAMDELLADALRQLPRWERESREQLRDLAREVSAFAVSAVMEDEREHYRPFPDVIAYFDAVQKDIVANVGRISPSRSDADESGPAQEMQEGDGPAFLRRYRVNVLVDNGDCEGAPVVYEDNPTYANLVGRVEYLAQMGALVTDHNLIKPGALHHASGGFLVLDAAKVLSQPFAWEALKRALYARQVRIESLGQMMATANTISLEPEPTDLDVKIVLIGDRRLYHLLASVDTDLQELFKVTADFEEDTPRTPDSARAYASLLASIVKREELRPFDSAAIARVIDHGVRLAADSERISTRVHLLADLLTEADYFAGGRGAEAVTAQDVQAAIDAGLRRDGRLQDRLREAVLRNTVLVDTTGEQIGQVNGLSVLQIGANSFGQASRITAQAWLGKGEVLDIEREVDLAGPIHAKGVLILAGFLQGRYAAQQPLTLSASLVFEQSYGGVEGDSASAGELYALLSAISGVPIRQSVAITGSVNQHGQVQAIGGVNDKIEGFFDLCRSRGLTGQQGVIMPESNIKDLMLRPRVVEAVAAGQFHVWAIRNIDEGVPLLMGVEAGQPGVDGQYPASSLNARVVERLAELAERHRAFAAPATSVGVDDA